MIQNKNDDGGSPAKELNDQARQGIAHPAEWNKWYSYARARKSDTLNAEEKAIWNSIWEVTSGLDKLVQKGIAARRKSLPNYTP